MSMAAPSSHRAASVSPFHRRGVIESSLRGSIDALRVPRSAAYTARASPRRLDVVPTSVIRDVRYRAARRQSCANSGITVGKPRFQPDRLAWRPGLGFSRASEAAHRPFTILKVAPRGTEVPPEDKPFP